MSLVSEFITSSLLGAPRDSAFCGRHLSLLSREERDVIRLCHPHLTVVTPGQGPDPIHPEIPMSPSSVCSEIPESRRTIKNPLLKKALLALVVSTGTWRKFYQWNHEAKGENPS